MKRDSESLRCPKCGSNLITVGTYPIADGGVGLRVWCMNRCDWWAPLMAGEVPVTVYTAHREVPA